MKEKRWGGYELLLTGGPLRISATTEKGTKTDEALISGIIFGGKKKGELSSGGR